MPEMSSRRSTPAPCAGDLAPPPDGATGPHAVDLANATRVPGNIPPPLSNPAAATTRAASGTKPECHLISDILPAAGPEDCNVLSDNLAGAAIGGREERESPSAETGAASEGIAIAAGPAAGGGPREAVIELRVRNHAGAMSHITGLFARRAFNLEAILCAPRTEDAGATSRMLLLVANQPRLEQVERQLLKLHDVLELRHRPDLDRAYFCDRPVPTALSVVK